MALLRLLVPAFVVLGACSYKTDPTANDGSIPDTVDQGGTSGAGPRAAAGSNGGRRATGGAKNSAAGSTNHPTRPPDDPPEPDPEPADSGAAGAITPVAPPPPESCDLDSSCLSDCSNRTVTCGVEPGVACEFEGFTGATAEVACNQRKVIGMACCGSCGCVPVEVFFDGTYCWQGVPQCQGGALGNRMLFPHRPTTANPSYTLPSDVPGSFYLGSGGFAGNEAAGGSAGNRAPEFAGNGGLGGSLVQGAGGGSGAEARAGASGAGLAGEAGSSLTPGSDGGANETRAR